MSGPSCYKKTESGIAHLCLLASNVRTIRCSFTRDIISLVWLRRQFHLSIALYDEWSQLSFITIHQLIITRKTENQLLPNRLD